MNYKTLFLSLLLLTLISGCNNKRHNISEKQSAPIPIKEHAIQSVLWQQNAAEYKALCYQAFNTAQWQLEKMLKNIKSSKPLAIITDIDETILDNSPYSVELIEKNQNYKRDSWLSWGKKESAILVPGAAEFLKFAKSKGVEVFYVSNRYDIQTPETINNLKKHNLPNADTEHLLLRTGSSGKEQRREKIKESHEVLMLLGDNLSDFHHLFDDKNSEQRDNIAHDMKKEFGARFIVFPNPMYGDWEGDGVYDGKRLTESEKRKARKNKLRR